MTRGRAPIAGVPVRAAGRARDASGRMVLWSVAEGGRGRRWREATLDGVSLSLARSMTLETGPDRTARRLEMASGVGLLTLHPEPDGVHGNVVSSRGVRPITLPAVPVGTPILPVGSLLAATALCWSLERRVAAGSRLDLRIVRVDLGEPGDADDAVAWLDQVTVQRLGAGLWRFVGAIVGVGGAGSNRDAVEIRIDTDGLPLPDPGERWPLEPEEPSREPS